MSCNNSQNPCGSQSSPCSDECSGCVKKSNDSCVTLSKKIPCLNDPVGTDINTVLKNLCALIQSQKDCGCPSEVYKINSYCFNIIAPETDEVQYIQLSVTPNKTIKHPVTIFANFLEGLNGLSGYQSSIVVESMTKNVPLTLRFYIPIGFSSSVHSIPGFSNDGATLWFNEGFVLILTDNLGNWSKRLFPPSSEDPVECS